MKKSKDRILTNEEKKEEAKRRAKKWYLDNPERAVASRRAWYLRNKEKMRQYNADYRKEHKEDLQKYEIYRYENNAKRKESCKKWVNNNPEKNRERVKNWQRDNPDKCRGNRLKNSAKRRAKIKKGPHEFISPDLIYAKDQGLCGICGKHLERSEFTIDHIVPISKGGGHVEGNVHSAHRLCNIRRSNRPLDVLYSI